MATIRFSFLWILPVILATAIVLGDPDEIEAPEKDCVVSGVTIPVGETKQVQKCLQCECAGPDDFLCYTMECPVAVCTDAIKEADSCCFECPNGRNCYGPKGDILRDDEGMEYDDLGERCECEQEDFFNQGEYVPAKANCFPLPVPDEPSTPLLTTPEE